MSELSHFFAPRYLTALLSLREVAKQSRVGIASSSRMLSRLLAMTFLDFVGARVGATLAVAQGGDKPHLYASV